MKIKDLQGEHTLRRSVPAQGTAATTNRWNVGRLPTGAKITSVTWIPDAAVTGANTNNFALQLQNGGSAGQGTTGVTAAKTYASGTDSVANTPEALTLSGTAANLLAAAGDVLVLARTVNSSGLASPSGTLEVTYTIR
jgi:hypothetical protein